MRIKLSVFARLPSFVFNILKANRRGSLSRSTLARPAAA